MSKYTAFRCPTDVLKKAKMQRQAKRKKAKTSSFIPPMAAAVLTQLPQMLPMIDP